MSVHLPNAFGVRVIIAASTAAALLVTIGNLELDRKPIDVFVNAARSRSEFQSEPDPSLTSSTVPLAETSPPPTAASVAIGDSASIERERPAPGQLFPEEVVSLINEYRAGGTVASLAKRYHVSSKTVRAYLAFWDVHRGRTPTTAAKKPVRPPVKTPVQPPVKTPVQPPVTTPVQPPVTTPVQPPVTTPVQPPVTTPAKKPAKTPTNAPRAPRDEVPRDLR